MTTYIVYGLGYGDEGKGATVDALARRHPGSMVVRFNGGAQAAHNVVTPDGKHHTFSQFGSNMFDPEAITCLSEYMLLNPFNLVSEAERLSKATGINPLNLLKRVYIDIRTPIITPYHIAANRARELARKERHGSCGQGIGELASDLITHSDMVIRYGDFFNSESIIDKLKFWRAAKGELVRSLGQDTGVFDDDDLIEASRSTYFQFYHMTKTTGEYFGPDHPNRTMIFEGAQGVLLDENYGFHPHTTWSTTTPENAGRIAVRSGYQASDIQMIGVTRSYMTRHGAGPLVTEGTYEAPEPHNGTGVFQGTFRTGALDLVALRYTLAVSNWSLNRSLRVTHMDKVELRRTMPVCVAYDTVSDLPVTSNKGDLDYQESLRILCEKSKPIIEHWPATEFLDRLQEALALPLHSATYGPSDGALLYT